MAPSKPTPLPEDGVGYTVSVPADLYPELMAWATRSGLMLTQQRRGYRPSTVDLERVPGSVDVGRWAGLTRRQTEILALIAEGLDNRGIGARMFLSPETVRSHVRQLLANLGVHDRVAAVDRGWRLGILGKVDP